jgi:hypothetical protein
MTHPQCSADTGDAIEALAEKFQQHWQGGGHAYTRPWNNGTDKDCVHGLPRQADFFRQLARIAIPGEPQEVGMRAALEDVSNWLEGCLQCKTWSWDGLQRDAAEAALAEAQAALALSRPQRGD